ncbi:hypothetical protein [Aliivibrio salmonicida]|uniref:hypothetical protein n=1 Tax=Aliivibrio salmonicida TaxID=40269 RepID=UPI003D0F3D7B
MKKNFTLPQITLFLFSLLLVSLCINIAMPSVQTQFEPTDTNVYTSSVMDKNRLNSSEMNIHHAEQGLLLTPFSHPLRIEPLSFLKPRVIDAPTKPPSNPPTVTVADRRLQVKQWVSLAMTVIIIPSTFYKQTIDNNRLGGWKESNLQYKTVK